MPRLNEPGAAPSSTTVVASGLGRCEGPLLLQSGGMLTASMSKACVFEIEDGGGVSVWAATGGGTNGLAEGPDGRVYVAQMGRRGGVLPEDRITGGVQIASSDGTVEWLTQDPISPNDLCFGPDGLLYLTDPSRRPWDDGRLWRCDIESGEAELLTSVGWYPNGIAFGLESDALYVASTSNNEVLRYPLNGGALGRPERFAELPYGKPDGLAFDVGGNLVVCAVDLKGAPGEIHVYDRDGRLVERRRLGDSSLYTNVAIDAQGTAFVTDTDRGELLRISDWADPGLPLHPFRV